MMRPPGGWRRIYALNGESIRFHFDMAALDDPRAKQLSEKDFWDPSLVDEIRRSGFVEQLYKN